MAEGGGTSFVAECFWSGVRQDDLRELDRRIEASVEHDVEGQRVRYLGSMLIVDDEVVLCLFDGPMTTVQRVVERAGIRFERILQSTHAPWPDRTEP